MLRGYWGRILRFNLATGEAAEEPLSEKVAYNFIGARGVGIYYLYHETPTGLDPLSAESKLIFMTGPLAGTKISGSERLSVVFKSPLTGTAFESSLGGVFGNELKKSGWDGVIVEGKAPRPSYLLIQGERAELRDASEFWGKLTSEVEEELRRRHLGGEALEIGPAGENLVYFASIMHRTRTAGRGGGGAVMGSKNLKALVVKGEREVEVASREAYERCVKRFQDILMNDPVTGLKGSLATFGTNAIIHRVNDASTLPVMNFAQSRMGFDEVDRFSGETVREKFFHSKSGCYRCPTVCGRVVTVKGRKVKGPEYETVAMLGANAGFHDYESEIVPLSILCDELGLDTISAGNILGFAREAGHFDRCNSKEEAFGEAVRLLHEIASGKSVYSKGVLRAARELGREELAMHVKGLEMPAYHPAGALGMALNYATVPKGADHTSGYTIAPELFGHPAKVDAAATEGKAHLVVRMQDAYAIYDSASLCIYHSIADFDELEFRLDILANLLTAVTGLHFTSEILHEAGRRIINLERAFNRREGITREQDRLPRRLKLDIDKMLDEYYRERGWA